MKLKFWIRKKNEVTNPEVARGVELLNAHVPNWRRHVDTDRLDMRSTSYCVLGQLNAAGVLGDHSVWNSGNYSNASRALGLNRQEQISHGFDLYIPWNAGRALWSNLTDQWLQAIRN